jgi:uncharacterized membrane protein
VTADIAGAPNTWVVVTEVPDGNSTQRSRSFTLTGDGTQQDYWFAIGRRFGAQKYFAGIRFAVWAPHATKANRNIVRNLQKVEMSEGPVQIYTQRGDCNYWQVTFPISRYDNIEVTGIVEDGIHAKVDVSTLFVITPLGMDLKKQTSASGVLFDDLANTLADKNSYATIQGTVPFEKYYDGWKISEAAKQAEPAQHRDTAEIRIGRQEENPAQIRHAQIRAPADAN